MLRLLIRRQGSQGIKEDLTLTLTNPSQVQPCLITFAHKKLLPIVEHKKLLVGLSFTQQTALSWSHVDDATVFVGDLNFLTRP
jgi:hypothetical protein